ncbi:hypothetical protein BOTBODRAFT_53221 [Botryobasidium botryosum FD-172 SS1]|uniref:W2 domain-containing protein n=1 Tax=Botryobasidium botryosum (strain FD-172 SS1) TaxID=930990 RepID=A0A067N1L3_BOTB1|nr:hypothetical protein BOTBODRAFT_53221 [Botryobasidium botryosum FD-172 SS1]
MAGVVNIRRDVDDKFYRYRMPILLTKIEGKGNGIKTVIPNMADVARALSRPPTYPTKFFGCELGAQTTFDEKNDRYIVNGAHDATRLRELLDAFIDKFVLCGSCKNPETDLILTKNDDIFRDCKACGARSNIDMRHKLTTFIVKNPPKTKKSKKSANGGAAKDKDKEGGGGSEEGGDNEGSDDELTKRIKAEAAELPTAEQASTTDDWSLDTSPEAVRARAKGLAAQLQNNLVLGDDDEDDGEGGDTPYEQLQIWVQDNRDTVSGVEVYKKAQELGIEGKHKTVLVLGEALFTEDVLKEIPKFTPLLKKMVTSEKHQKSLLGGTERLVGLDYPSLIPAIPKILMAYYQADILEEEVVTQWGTHVSKKYVDKDTCKKVRKASAPFLEVGTNYPSVCQFIGVLIRPWVCAVARGGGR